MINKAKINSRIQHLMQTKTISLFHNSKFKKDANTNSQVLQRR